MPICSTVPTPVDAYLSFPGLALASSISSRTLLACTLLLVTSTSGSLVIMLTGAKSRNGS